MKKTPKYKIGHRLRVIDNLIQTMYKEEYHIVMLASAFAKTAGKSVEIEKITFTIEDKSGIIGYKNNNDFLYEATNGCFYTESVLDDMQREQMIEIESVL